MLDFSPLDGIRSPFGPRRGGGGPAPAFSPSTLFALAEPGVWYDPSDLTTLFQDTAGTIPVTTPGQTVALMLDKSRGLTLGPEKVANGDFSSGSTDWTLGTGISVTGDALVFSSAPVFSVALNAATTYVAGRTYRVDFTVSNATAGGLAVQLSNGNSAPSVTYEYAIPITNGNKTLYLTATGQTTFRMYNTSAGASFTIDNISVRELPGNHATQGAIASRPTYGVVPLGGRRNLLSQTDTMSTQSVTVTAVAQTLSFTGTGTVTLSGASTAGPLVGTGAGNRVSLTFTPTAASLTLTVSGSVTLSQLELGSAVTNYQRVGVLDVPSGLSFDVTEAGVQSLSYLYFNGVSTFMVTGTITPGVNKAQVFAGVRKLSDATFSVLYETSLTTQVGTISSLPSLSAGGGSAAPTWSVYSSGVLVATPALYAAPQTVVQTHIADISAPALAVRINGTQVAQSAISQGTGNYLAYPLYIGRRGGTIYPFNGNIFSLLVRFGANLTAGQITDAETWVNGKTGAY